MGIILSGGSTKHRSSRAIAGLAAVLFVGCANPSEMEVTADTSLGPAFVPREGKHDDFRSPIATEFEVVVRGREFQIPPGVADQPPETLAIVVDAYAKTDAAMITTALRGRFAEEFPDHQAREGTNTIVLRRDATEVQNLEHVEGITYRYDYRMLGAGPSDVTQRFDTFIQPFVGPFPEPYALARHYIELQLYEAYVSYYDREAPPEAHHITLDFRLLEDTDDSFPHYFELFEGGLDIAIHVGDDPNEDDLNQFVNLFVNLRDDFGLTPPVQSPYAFTLETGPFVGDINVDGTPVEVRVRIFHADMAEDDALEPLLEAYRESARTADIIIYRGHGGAGVDLHYEPLARISDNRLNELQLSGGQQIFVFDGCSTYNYADPLFGNPTSRPENIDVVTTVNLATHQTDGRRTRAFLRGVLDRVGGQWFPNSWNTILSRMDREDTDPHWIGMFAVLGLADNPKVSPYFDHANIGASCESHDDCPGVDALCAFHPEASRLQCGAQCAASDVCPEGTECIPTYATEGSTYREVGQCLRRSL